MISYGGDIYQTYEDRSSDLGIKVGQGNLAQIFITDLETNYLINSANNTNLFMNLSYRKTSIEKPLANFYSGTNIWFSIGLRSDLFNWYFDF